jgi:hypothetical protein
MGKSKQIYLNVGILLLITVVNSLLARFGVIACPIGPGSSGLYFSVAFMIPFTLWFGAWGAIAAYLGCFIGAGVLAHMPLTLNLYWSFLGRSTLMSGLERGGILRFSSLLAGY